MVNADCGKRSQALTVTVSWVTQMMLTSRGKRLGPVFTMWGCETCLHDNTGPYTHTHTSTHTDTNLATNTERRLHQQIIRHPANKRAGLHSSASQAVGSCTGLSLTGWSVHLVPRLPAVLQNGGTSAVGEHGFSTAARSNMIRGYI